jgi:hypothetical protein
MSIFLKKIFSLVSQHVITIYPSLMGKRRFIREAIEENHQESIGR